MYHLYGIKFNIIFEHSTKLSFLISAKKKKKFNGQKPVILLQSCFKKDNCWISWSSLNYRLIFLSKFNWIPHRRMKSRFTTSILLTTGMLACLSHFITEIKLVIGFSADKMFLLMLMLHSTRNQDLSNSSQVPKIFSDLKSLLSFLNFLICIISCRLFY